jgi:heat shock protein HslJ
VLCRPPAAAPQRPAPPAIQPTPQPARVPAPVPPRQPAAPAVALPLAPPRPPAAPQPPRPAPTPAAVPVVPPPPQYPGQVPGQPPKPVPRVGDRLHETRWRVETIQGRPVIRGKEPTLEFLRDDHLRGGTGCNRFVGPWHTRATRAVMGPLRKSRLTCRPDLAQQEQQFLDTLERTERFELKDEGRTLLVYSSLSTAPSRFTRLP